MSSARKLPPSVNDDVPLSLGKPSLRRRLEAYYRQVAPEQIANHDDWKDRFEKIWEKFGNSFEGERKLRSKLEKKYGVAVRLRIVVETGRTVTLDDATRVAPSNAPADAYQEEHYDLTEHQRGSGVLRFTAVDFDPVATLSAPRENVVAANPWLERCSLLLDRVEQCRSVLPQTDPLFKKPVSTKLSTKRASAANAPTTTATTTTTRVKATPIFAAMAMPYREGPFSTLYEALMRRKRIRVLIRYSAGIRGTLTGQLVAFDKHFNLILRDVQEVYSPQMSTEEEGGRGGGGGEVQSKTEMEVNRRIKGYTNDTLLEGTTGWSCRQRHMEQIMVRGDTVVLVYKPEQEQSCWPMTRRSPGDTIYRKRSVRRNVPPAQRIGSPGSLSLAARRQQRTRHHSSQPDARTGSGDPKSGH